MLLFLLALAAFRPAAAAPPSAPPLSPPPRLERGELALPSGKVLQVELAVTPEQIARGYMFRSRVGRGEGMLFFMGELGFHSFWMKNCRVALDIVWLDEAWRIVHIEREVPPCAADPCPGYAPMQAALYVLEIRAGGAGKEGLKLGDTLFYHAAARRPQP